MTNANLLLVLITVVHVAFLRGTVAMKSIDPVLNAAIVKALLTVLFDFDVEPKVAMDWFGYDKSQWSRMCSGERPAPSIARISSALSWPMLAAFIPEWSKVVAQHKLIGVTAGADSIRRTA